MPRVTVRDRNMRAHSTGEVFRPAPRLHGATYEGAL
jgi:hypothetical protein